MRLMEMNMPGMRKMRRYHVRRKYPIAFDLFCGCGGLTLGLKQAGFRVVYGVDIDPLSMETYRMNHPEVRTHLGNIRKLSIAKLMKRLRLRPGDLDLLAGCPPCQGFSTMRTLNGGKQINDPQNDLVFEFLRFVLWLRPKAVMLENVPGLLTDRRMGSLLAVLKWLGYRYKCDVLNAADFGVPQRRRRMIMLAARRIEVAFAEADTERTTVRTAIGSLPMAGKSGDPLHDLPEKRTARVIELITKVPKDGGSRTDLGSEDQLDCHKKCSGFKDVYGRMAWENVAPTITTGCFNPSKGRFLHPEANRAITLREAALLQSFPHDYQFSLKKGKSGVAAMVGNALPPEFIRRVAGDLHKRLVGKEE